MSDEISQLNNTVNNVDPGQNTGQAVVITKPPLISFGNLLSQTWAFYKKRAKVFLLILAIPAVFNIAFGFLSEFVGYFAGLFTLVGFFLSIWAGLALLFAVIDDQLNLKQAFTAAWHKLLSYFWLAILSALVVMGGFFLFIIPGIIFSVQFTFSVYVFVKEGLKGREALLKSKAYVKDYWWSILGRLVVLQLLLMLAFIPLGFILGFGSMLMGLATAVIDSHIFSFLFGLITSIIVVGFSILIAPFSMIYSFLLYQDVKFKKPNLVFEPKAKDKIYLILWAVWVIVAVGLITSLTIIGVLFFRSSDTDLAKAFRDTSRTNHQFQILCALNGYYYNQKEYPQSLDGLKNNNYLLNAPQDPKTGQAYEYELTEQGQNFSLCLNFEKKDRECFDKEAFKEQSEGWPQDQNPQFNFLWTKFTNKPIQWFSAIIGARNLLTH